MNAIGRWAAVEPLEARRLFSVDSVSLVTPGGSPVSGWGTSGDAAINTGFDQVVPQALVPQSNGGTLVAGTTDDATAHAGRVFVERMTASGRPDPTFGAGGIVLTTLSNFSATLRSAGQSSDGSITLLVNVENSVTSKSGTTTVVGADVLLRYTSAGKLDRHFGRGGILGLNAKLISKPQAMAVSPDGRITIAGQWVSPRQKAHAAQVSRPAKGVGAAGVVIIPQPSAFEILRLNGHGRPDQSFSRSGVIRRAGGFSDTPEALALGADGSVAVSGNAFFSDAWQSAQTVVLRYDGRGKIDPLFGSNGIAIANAGVGQRIAIGPDDQAVLGGLDSQGSIEVAQYTPGGQLDRQFGSAGVVRVAPADSSELLSRFAGLIVTWDDRITVAGSDMSNVNANPMAPDIGAVIARLNADGTPETSFGASGQLAVPIGTGNGAADAIAFAFPAGQAGVFLAYELGQASNYPITTAGIDAFTLPVYPTLP